MFLLHAPTPAEVRTFLAGQRAAAPTAPIGLTDWDKPPRGFALARTRFALGHGPNAEERACAALRGWAPFRAGWVQLRGDSPTLEVGATAALHVRLFGGPRLGLHLLIANRVVRMIEEPGRFGFLYGTLPGHVLQGEERFLIETDERGHVTLELLTVSRPAGMLGSLARPLARPVIAQFQRLGARHYGRAVARASGVAPPARGSRI